MARIVGGSAGGRRLAAPAGRGTRPTAERVREGLFSTLESMLGSLAGYAFLDLYAGSGAVGLEAASRGADPVVLVERSRPAAEVIARNVESTGLAAGVQAMSVASYLRGAGPAFDVVFVDPPYAEPAGSALALLVEHDRLTAEGLVVVERATRGAPPEWPHGYVLDRSRRYGDTTLWYGRRSVTNGHLDVIERVSSLFDEVVVAVGVNQSKNRLFEADERITMIREATAGLPNVSVDTFSGLLVEFCQARGIRAIVKGLRAVSDFDYELQMGQMNHSLAGVETLFIPTNPLYSFLSSSLVKEVATYGGDVTGLVPDVILRRLQDRLAR